jgi:hypothetical protein
MMNKYRSKLIAQSWRSGFLLAVALSTLSLRAQADGGDVTLHQTAGPFVITVFTASGAPHVGLGEISVLAQNRTDGQVALDVEVFVRLRSIGGMVVTARATREMSRNKLLYSALVNLPEAGLWELEVTIKRGMSQASVFGQLYVVAPGPFLISYWRSLSLPWVVVTLFAMNQWLKGRAASRGKKRLTTPPAKLRCGMPNTDFGSEEADSRLERVAGGGDAPARTSITIYCRKPWRLA